MPTTSSLSLKSISLIFPRLISQLLFPELLISESPLHPPYQSWTVVHGSADLEKIAIIPASVKKRGQTGVLSAHPPVHLSTYPSTLDLFLTSSRAQQQGEDSISSETKVGAPLQRYWDSY